MAHKQWTPDDCLRALRRAREHYGHFPTISQYEAFRSREGNMPSETTIRINFNGGWLTAVHEAKIRERL